MQQSAIPLSRNRLSINASSRISNFNLILKNAGHNRLRTRLCNRLFKSDSDYRLDHVLTTILDYSLTVKYNCESYSHLWRHDTVLLLVKCQ